MNYTPISSIASSTIISQLLPSFTPQLTKEDFLTQISMYDSRISNLYSNQQLDGYIPQQIVFKPSKNQKAFQLTVPKNNTLTDSLLRTTLGCDQKLAKSYLEIITKNNQQQAQLTKVQQTKKKFAQANSHKDFCANSKLHQSSYKPTNLRPVVENQHESYLKTQLIFLEKGKNQTKQSKHLFTVTKNIRELGGMEDTVAQMEQSLVGNQIKQVKNRSLIKNQKFNNTQLNSSKKKDSKGRYGFFSKSKQMRNHFIQRIH